MKKILFLGLMSLLLLSGCNKNNEGVKLLKNSYNYSNKVRYELPVKNYGNVESFLSSINLSKKNFGFKVDYNCNYFDYYDLYFFKYDGMNIIMRNLNDYVCLKDERSKINGDDYYNIELLASIFYIVDKFGLPDETSGSQYYFTYNYSCDEYATRANLLFTELRYYRDTYYLQFINISKNWY